MEFYFTKYEDRVPPKALPYSVGIELIWQLSAVVALTLGLWYIAWRWTSSLNTDALWFAIPLVLAESFAYIGLIFFVFNLWKTKDYVRHPAPQLFSECTDQIHNTKRPISVDVYFPTYDEDPELVRLSLHDAKNIRYPHNINMNIFVLDDGNRSSMKEVALEEEVEYITRHNNVGFKAGNLRNAMEQTQGDFIVICDADTRPLPSILENTLGYFTDPKVAWVQTPQWFFDIDEGKNLRDVCQKYAKKPGYWFGNIIEKIIGDIKVGRDPFSNDPNMFYDVILRRRNWANASFCCGAGSIHRRDAVMQAAMKTFADEIDGYIRKYTKDIDDEIIKEDLSDAMKKELMLEKELTPYKFHVSEDIYTSIIIHSDKDAGWKSVYHPNVESKMLSPQDFLSWSIQRFKYAGGSLDICLRDKQWIAGGMTWKQKLMYATTFWSYFSGVWNVIFLIAPSIYLFTGIAPISADSIDFFKHFLPFILSMQLAFMFGSWGISTWRGSSFYMSMFPIILSALWTVLRGKKIKFPITPKSRQDGNFIKLVIPQLVIVILTFSGIVYALTHLFLGHQVNVGGIVANCFWGIINITSLSGIIYSSVWKPEEEKE